MKKKIKPTLKILGIILLVYLVVSGSFFLLQDSIIFQSKSLSKNYQFEFEEKYEEYFIPTGDGETLNVLLFKSPAPSKGLILYFHGNADNLQRWGRYAVDFTSLGYDVLMMDYRGFGKSTGRANEINLYNDAQTVLHWAQANIQISTISIYGRSLGSAVASNLATVFKPDQLILETPFDELKGVVYPPIRPMLFLFPPRYKFSNKDHLRNQKCSTVIIHGTNDWVVPIASAVRLKPFLKKDDKFIVIEKGGHKNLRDFESYHEALKEVLN